MKKLVLLLVATVLLVGCAPKPTKVEVKAPVAKVVEPTLDEKSKSPALDLQPRIQSMMDELAPLVERSKKIGKTDFTKDYENAKVEFDAFKIKIGQGKFADAVVNGNTLLGNLLAMQTTIAEASQSGKKK